MRHKLESLAPGLIAISLATPTAFAMDAMSVAQQNALVQKYRAVCHTDAANASVRGVGPCCWMVIVSEVMGWAE